MANRSGYVETPTGLFSLPAAAYTLTGALDLSTSANKLRYEPVLMLDPGGSTRVVTLEAEADAVNLTRYIGNTADASEDLTVNNDGGSLVVTVPRQRLVALSCNGTTWSVIGNFFVLSAT